MSIAADFDQRLDAFLAATDKRTENEKRLLDEFRERVRAWTGLRARTNPSICGEQISPLPGPTSE